jgi:two-component system cell cycle response regulator DivK
MAKLILYVEDHLNNMLLVKRIVQAEGHEFLAAADGMVGWQLANEHVPDLIFVDLRLPGDIDGYGMLRMLKEDAALNHIPAVVLTAYGHGDAQRRAKEAGCDGFLNKPADIQQIRAIIRQYVGPPANQPFLTPQRLQKLALYKAP